MIKQTQVPIVRLRKNDFYTCMTEFHANRVEVKAGSLEIAEKSKLDDYKSV
jgi:hypothetical protein